jgi:hypothetical protein
MLDKSLYKRNKSMYKITIFTHGRYLYQVDVLKKYSWWFDSSFRRFGGYTYGEKITRRYFPVTRLDRDAVSR